MAIELDATRATIIASMLVVLAGVAYLELRVLRNRRKKREDRGEIPDRAHNALLSAQGIAETLGRSGIRSVEADSHLREAENAFTNRNYRVAMELAERARTLLRAEKARYEAKGDLAKLESTEPAPEGEPTVKEKLVKELPPNYMQAKFSLNLARDAIDAARNRGRDVGEAEKMLAEAQATFDATDYAMALAQASRVRRSVEGATPGSPPASPKPPVDAPTGVPTSIPIARAANVRPCQSCGATVAIDDAFCRKCGAKVPNVRACTSCENEVAADDPFCRKCGTKVPAV